MQYNQAALSPGQLPKDRPQQINLFIPSGGNLGIVTRLEKSCDITAEAHLKPKIALCRPAVPPVGILGQVSQDLL
jgi:hypothetical protein